MTLEAEYIPRRRPNFKFQYESEMGERILDVMAEGGFVREVCVAIGCPSTNAFYNQLKLSDEMTTYYEYGKMLGQVYYEKMLRAASKGEHEDGSSFKGNFKALDKTLRVRYPDEWREENAGNGANIYLNLPSNDIRKQIAYKLEANPQLLESLKGLTDESSGS